MASHDQDPLEPKPVDSIEWKGSRAEIYNGIEIESAQGRVIIYDRSDYNTPIERVKITAEILNYPDLDQELGLSLQADIQLDRSLATGKHREFVSKFSAYIPYTDKDGTLTFNRTRWHNMVVVSHSGGVKTVVGIGREGDKLSVTNDVLYTENDQVLLKTLPQSLEAMESTETLKGFMAVVMRTIDFASGIDSYDPRRSHLKRVYPVGREIRPYKEPIVSPDVGRTALKGRKRTEKQSQIKKLEELGVELGKDEITLDDVGGLHHVKSMLRDIVTSFKSPEVMEKWGAKRPQGVLLYGEPGTGKTMLAQALANELGAEMWSIQSTDIHEKWLGESERHIKEIFERAKSVDRPTVLFFDEFESIIGITEEPLTGGADNARNAVAGIFKQEMNNLAKINPNILVVAATNDLDRIDSSLMRSGRFDHKVYVPMPDQEARQEIISGIVSTSMFSNESEEFKVFADDLQVPEVAELTDGMSGADIAEIFRRLSLEKAMEEARSGKPQDPIKQAEIRQAILDFKQLG